MNVGAFTPEAVALALKLNAVELSIDTMVAPTGTPVPVTNSPTKRALVSGKSMTLLLPVVRVPFVGPCVGKTRAVTVALPEAAVPLTIMDGLRLPVTPLAGTTVSVVGLFCSEVGFDRVSVCVSLRPL